MFVKTQAIVLRQNKFSDNKRIVTILTQSHGKKNFIVYNSKKNKNSFFQSFFILNLDFNYKENQNLTSIKEVALNVPFNSIPYNNEKMAIAFFLSEIINKILEENFQDTVFFDFLKNSIILLDNHPKPANFHIAFLAAMSVYVGIMPKQNYSVENKYFNFRDGQFSFLFDKQFSFNEFYSFKFQEILNAGIEGFDNVKLIQSERNILLKNILEFYAFHFNSIKNLKSLDVLQEVFQT
ncbi:MAG TPA: DNA repair protein RecO [Bacteroidetes bacterium]|nr:DNA repair protein RecO [Bacteroidota bacterium]